MTREYGIGLVGAGRFGEFCVEALHDLPDGRVRAVMDTDRARAADVAPDGAAVYDDFEALLADPDVDIVHVRTAPFLHGSMTRRAAERGKHVFVEKPLATSLEDARAAIATANDNRVQLSIDYVLRQHPLHRLAIELSQSRALAASNNSRWRTLPRPRISPRITGSGIRGQAEASTSSTASISSTSASR